MLGTAGLQARKTIDLMTLCTRSRLF
ncbi:MAG: hypothetical protein FD124_3567, partial [Alphaproteobacteria bacterium]